MGLFALSITSASVLLLALTSNNWINHNAYLCKFRECCHPNDGTGFINYERGVEQLLDTLRARVYGQPLIIRPIYKSLRAHVTNERPPRPLVLYFSGWTGTGKTYVAKLIANALYKEGMNSRFVKYISSSFHFPAKIETERDIAVHRQRLRDMIRDTVRACERSLIVLDELDKLPAGVVDSLQPLVDYVDDVDGVKYNKAIFVFLSNTGAESLNKLAYKMFTEGKERKDLSAKDVEEILIMESFNEPGGLRQSSLLKRYSIGVFVPFLPLERQHVKLCIRDELEAQSAAAAASQPSLELPDEPHLRQGQQQHQQHPNLYDDHDKPASDELVEEIADELAYFPDDTRLYSKSGCKGVHNKVTNYLGPQVQVAD